MIPPVHFWVTEGGVDGAEAPILPAKIPRGFTSRGDSQALAFVRYKKRWVEVSGNILSESGPCPKSS
jgi:hypothetical protein